MSANSFSYSNHYGANLTAPDMTATNLPQEEHSASDTDATSSGSDSGSDDNGSASSSSKKVVRDERGNREKTLIKLTSTYDTTVLQEGFEESRLTRNLGGKSTKEMVIHAKDLTILSEKQLSKTINDNFRSNPTNSAEYAQLQGIPAFNVPRLLRMFFTVGFKRLDSPSFYVDPEGLQLAFFHPNFQTGKDDPLKFFDPTDNSDAERLKIQRYVMDATLNVQFMFQSLMKRQFQKLFDPVVQSLQGCFAPHFAQPIHFVVYEFQLLMSNLTHDAIHVPTREPWSSSHRAEKFKELITSQFLSSSSGHLYTMLTVRVAQSGNLFLSGDNTAKRRGDDIQQDQNRGPKSRKTAAKGKGKSKKKTDGGATQVTATTTNPPPANPLPVPPAPAAPAPTQTRSMSSRSNDYCRTHLLNVLGLTNSSGQLYVCSRQTCTTNPALHSNVTVTSSSSKTELEAFMATPSSQTNWSGSNAAAVFQRSAIATFIANK